MNKIYLNLAVFFLLIFVIISKDSPEKWPNVQSPHSQPLKLTEQKQYLFNQILDHFNYQKTSYWKQRYWVVDDFFNPKVGPVFLYICGQYTCSGIPQQRQWIVTLAQKTFGLIFVVQHRYYGQSLPFGNSSMKIQNMIYLNSEQALSDLAFFINEVNVNQMFKVNKNPWITVGGSYPGALSAWFRYKYPHLTVGAIASSAVVTAIQNFQDFDEQMFISTNKSGDYCYNALNNSNVKVESILLSTNGTQFKKQFKGGEFLSNQQFMFFWIDSFVMQVQYGTRTTFCQTLKGKNENDQFDYFIKLAKASEVYEYGSYYLKNETFAIQKKSSARAWYYQSCTQFGYWQTPSSLHPMRSKWLGIQFYKKFCVDAYGVGTWPKIERKNIQYGGFNQQSFNLLMNNGVQDPWIWASIQKPQGNIIARVANCDNCAHCVELYTPSSKDAPQLKKIRDQQFTTIQGWIQQYWRNLSVPRKKLSLLSKLQSILQVQ